jgi:VWFA-related protein
MLLRRQARILLAILLLGEPSFSQAPATQVAQAPAPPNGAQQPATEGLQPSIRSTTRLVQVSVVAVDKSGNPVTGLQKEDFTLTDQGAPQSIAVFASEAPAPATPPVKFPANIFTNRYDLKGEDPGAVTIILFDALNTSAEDQAYVRKQILKFLQTMKPQDHVTIYALTNKLLILHDFTQDATALVNAVSHFTPKETAAFDKSNTPLIDLVDTFGDPGFGRLQAAVNNANGQISDQAIQNNVVSTTNALAAIADHVAVVPGRKSLVWVSGGFPLQIGIDNIGLSDRDVLSFANTTSANTLQATDQPVGGSNNPNQLPTPDRDLQTSIPNINPAIAALNRNNISIYPVDVHGTELSAGMSPDNRLPATTLAAQGFYGRRDRYDSFNVLADRTGGVAFYGNNDVREGIQRAFDDGRFAYTLGFYPDHNTWDGKFRDVKITVNKPGVKLRYRKGYFAVPEMADSAAAVVASLQNAAFSPLEATTLGMIVAVQALAPAAEHKLELRVAIDPKQLLLKTESEHRKGVIDMMYVQTSATGDVLASEKQRLDLNFDEKQFAHLAKVGAVFLRHVTADAKATQLRVIVRDAASGNLGSVAIPLKDPFPVVAPAGAPVRQEGVPTLGKPGPGGVN